MSSKPMLCAGLTTLCVFAGAAQPQKGEQPAPVNPVLTMLPVAPKLETPLPPVSPPSQDSTRPPAPPPPPLSRHFAIPLIAQANSEGVYFDFALPGGRLAGMRWVAVGPGNVNVTSDIEVALMSPSMLVRLSPTGETELLIDQRGGNVRAIARKKKPMGAVQIMLSIDLDQL